MHVETDGWMSLDAARGRVSRCFPDMECCGGSGSWTFLRVFTSFSMVIHFISIVVCVADFESVWMGLLMVALAGKLILVCWMLIIGWRNPMSDPTREVERWQQLQELHALMAIMCLLNGGTISSMGAVELQQPTVEPRRVLVPFFLAFSEFLCCATAFHGRQSAGSLTVMQIRTAHVEDSESAQKQRAAEIQWHFLLHLTNYNYSATHAISIPGQGEDVQKTTTQATCPICLDGLSDGDEVSQPFCSHIFHRSCLEGWVETLSHNLAQHRRDFTEQVLCPLRCDSAKVGLVNVVNSITPVSSITPSSGLQRMAVVPPVPGQHER